MENFERDDVAVKEMRHLAQRWMELALSPLMQERRRLWTALKDRKAERPMFIFETWTLEGYIPEHELVCQDPFLRSVELLMRRSIRQAQEVGDDFVIDPVFRLSWHSTPPAYGVGLDLVHAQDGLGGEHAYHYNHPIRTPADVSRLQPRTWSLDIPRTRRDHAVLQDLFGDILPVILHGAAFFLPGLTADLYRLIGNDNLLTWVYDEPDAIHALMSFLRDDRISYYHWLETDGILGRNDNSSEVGSGSSGYVSDLPQSDFNGQVRLQDLWVWIESQETTMISPRVFTEFFLPYMADISRDFGLVYYGCCEPVHDRWDQITTAIPNIRAVSISPWCDQHIMGERLGREIIFSRKPKPWLISGIQPDWDALEHDIDETLHAARDCNLEIIYRDTYRIHGDRSRLRRWADLVRSRVGGEVFQPSLSGI